MAQTQLKVTVSGQDLGYAHDDNFHKMHLVTNGVMDIHAIISNVRTLLTIQGPGPAHWALCTKGMDGTEYLIRDKASVRHVREVCKPVDRMIKPSKMLVRI